MLQKYRVIYKRKNVLYYTAYAKAFSALRKYVKERADPRNEFARLTITREG